MEEKMAAAESFVEVVIGSDLLSTPGPAEDSPLSPLLSQQSRPTSPPSPLRFNGSTDPLSPSYVTREDLMAPMVSIQIHYQPHSCSQACLPGLPKSAHHLRGQNPLKLPLLCSFRRMSAPAPEATAGVWSDGAAEGIRESSEDLDGSDSDSQWAVVYQAPCGLTLGCPAEVLRFLLATESCGVLQTDYFSFHPAVRLDPPRCRLSSRNPPDRDLSRGAEPTPVELFVGEDGVRPKDFRYRKDRWPHGCFLSRGVLFEACCDCTDGCLEAESCACVRLTTGEKHYSYQRLSGPVPEGLYECGPWCGCRLNRCQNRVVQRGLRVRLQVFQTADRGWGVRCLDDLDQGTFICTYAGIVLKTGQDSLETPPSKRQRAELPSDDDEVEVVTEWLAPAGEGRGLSERPEASSPTSPPLHVPVIQRPADHLHGSPDKVKSAVVAAEQQPENTFPELPASEGLQKELVDNTGTVLKEGKGADTGPSPKRNRTRIATDHMYYLDATKEGNVGRFINHSCDPNLFVQNVFTDSHDPTFPVIAFFTSRVVKASTELTWNYSHDPGSTEEEVPCNCGSSCCQKVLI
ncbi:histone-lysine N-methyltransferase SETDB2 [Aplochiton taeniatus]